MIFKHVRFSENQNVEMSTGTLSMRRIWPYGHIYFCLFINPGSTWTLIRFLEGVRTTQHQRWIRRKSNKKQVYQIDLARSCVVGSQSQHKAHPFTLADICGLFAPILAGPSLGGPCPFCPWQPLCVAYPQGCGLLAPTGVVFLHPQWSHAAHGLHGHAPCILGPGPGSARCYPPHVAVLGTTSFFDLSTLEHDF